MTDRNEFILMAKLYENTEKFQLMFENINKFVALGPSLNKDERIILNNGYKNIITNQRRAWRELIKTETKELQSGNNNNKSEYAKELRVEVENEILLAADKVLEMVDKYLLPNASDVESRVFFYKMKADFLRYKAEVKLGEEYITCYKESADAYAEGQKIAEPLPISNTVKLGLALNYSVLMYEVVLNKESAIKLAKVAYDEAMKIIDDLDKTKGKETILLIQLLKENLSLWNNDNEEDNS